MIVVVQIACILFSVISIGQAIKNRATNVDKVYFSIFCILFLLLCVGLQGVK